MQGPRFSRAEQCGFLALGLALVMAWIHPLLPLIPLLFFLLCCLVAPFLPGYGFYLAITHRAPAKTKRVGLSFDDGPSAATTPVVLELLARYQLQATFFLIGEKAAAAPELVRAILEQGHTIGNHSWRHDPLLMLRSPATICQDLRATQELLARFAIRPLLFRPPAGITGPRLRQALAREQLTTVTFSCRALDRGNRQVRDLARRILSRVRPGDIIMLHDLPPQPEELLPLWQQELEQLLASLASQQRVVPLDELLGRAVMESNCGAEGKTAAPLAKGRASGL
ncbi:polysaccharide deacetylase family protein [Desulfogranum mediterraneum]|uniref:polysaccharide deacetylase family protein n=1 Tax=Desulfogranum mediterraneum TaxID=160661 RepID=UPI00040AD31D|nr:polysaccharide deacetylase family protein [Desulfogranum mediterraneum]